MTLFWFAVIYAAGIGTGLLYVANRAWVDEKLWIWNRGRHDE